MGWEFISDHKGHKSKFRDKTNIYFACYTAINKAYLQKLMNTKHGGYLDNVWGFCLLKDADDWQATNDLLPPPFCASYSEYGFAEKVVEGISLSINSIIIRISAKAFNASFELSQLQVYSVNTSWSIGDLRFTRIQDPQKGEVGVC